MSSESSAIQSLRPVDSALGSSAVLNSSCCEEKTICGDSSLRSHAGSGGSLGWCVLAAFCLAAVFAGLAAVWFAYDSRVPTTDEAGHILNALDYKNLLRHARPFKLDWWHHMLTVNNFYPPLVYIFNGVLKLALGNARWVDVLSVLVFSCTLTVSTFGITRLLGKSLFAACVASAVVNLYPLMSNMSHNFMLDFPLVSMISLGLLSLLWWQERTTWRRCLLAGLALAAACMTKQIAAAYLLLPGLWCFWNAVCTWRRTQSSREIQQVLAVAGCVLVVVCPWALANLQWIRGYSAETATNMANAGVHLKSHQVLADYLVGLGYSMSPFMCTLFFLSLLPLTLADHKKLIPVYLSGLGGLLSISSLTWTFPLDRYAAGVLIATAVVSGFGASRLVQRAGRLGFGVVAGVLLVSTLQLISFSYMPYPLNLPGADLSKSLGVTLREFRGLKIDKITPYPGGLLWGQDWVLACIKDRDGAAPVFLNILPSDGVFNAHSFELLAREKGLQVRPTTSRVWTIVGDKVVFSPETAKYYQWYLLKTGFQGNKLQDAASEAEYEKLNNFVRTGPDFVLVGEKTLPDSSILSLYRQR